MKFRYLIPIIAVLISVISPIAFGDGMDVNISVSPELAVVSKPVDITFTDEGGGVITERIYVDIKKPNGEVESEHTDTGILTFTPASVGKYEINLTNYYGSATFEAKNEVRIISIKPQNPQIGKAIELIISKGAGILITGPENFTGGNAPIVSPGGYVNITLNKPGMYLIQVLGYQSWGLNRSLTVSEKPTPTVTITPPNPMVGESVTISVKKTDQTLLGDARITIIKPNGVAEPTVIASTGEYTYTPHTLGTYTVKVSVEEYTTPEDKTFATKGREFEITFSKENPTVNDNIVLTITNKTNHPMHGAEIHIGEVIIGTTDSEGSFSLNLDEPREYEILVKLWGYTEQRIKITPIGILSINLTPAEIEIHQSISLAVFDSKGEPIRANIDITTPNETISMVDVNYTFTPKFVGKYSISAIKSGYIDATTNFKVNPIPLDIDTKIDGNRLIVRVTSYEKIVKNAMIVIKTPEGKEKSGITDTYGNLIVEIDKEGNYEVYVSKKYYGNLEKTIEVKKIKNFWLLGSGFAIILFAVIIGIRHFIRQDSGGKGDKRGKRDNNKYGLEKRETPAYSFKGK